MTAMHLSSRHGSGRDVDTAPRDWRTQGACRSEDPELFWPVGTSPGAYAQTGMALEVCHRCPVMDQCYRWGVETGMTEGVWGGTSEESRRRPPRSANQVRVRNILNAARLLAVMQGQEIVEDYRDGEDPTAIAARTGVSETIVRQALRYLQPEGELLPSAEPLERIMRQADILRDLVGAGHGDKDIASMMHTHSPTIADARRILVHLDAAGEQAGRIAA